MVRLNAVRQYFSVIKIVMFNILTLIRRMYMVTNNAPTSSVIAKSATAQERTILTKLNAGVSEIIIQIM